jgi:RimK-like ATP-grasp domain
MPWSEVITKDISSALSDLKNYITKGPKKPIIAFPDYPSKKTTLWKIANHLGYRLTNKLLPQPARVIYFEDITHGSSDELKGKYGGNLILNAACTDISKVQVDKIHLDVFGYNTFIDPAKYSGKAVMKSDTNALHDGKIIECPVESTIGSVYQVLIDNSFDDQFVMDLRVAVVGSEIVHAYKKFKKYEVRFTNQVSYSELHATTSLFNEKEINLILTFCTKMGLHFGELDILRNKDDGRIYIIDVNKTPYGPPFGLPSESAKKAIDNLSNAFYNAFLK